MADKPDMEPMVELATEAILHEARVNGADSPVDYGDAEQLARAALQSANIEGLVEALEYTRAALGDPVPIAKRHIARKIDAALAHTKEASNG